MTKNLVGAGYEKLEIGSGQDMSFSKENFSPGHFGTMAAILDIFCGFFLGGEEGEGAEGPQQGPKGPQPSAGARRRAAVGRPNLLV